MTAREETARRRPERPDRNPGVFLPALAGAGVAVAAAVPYQAAVTLVGFVYLIWIGTLAYGWLVGTVVGRTAKRVRARGKREVFAAAVAAALLGDLATFPVMWWVGTERDAFLAEREASGVVHAPSGAEIRSAFPLGSYTERVVEEGWEVGHGGHGIPIRGPLVVLAWFGEAALLAAVAARIALRKVDEPFFAKAGDWGSKRVLARMGGVDHVELRRASVAGDIDGLLSPRQVAGSEYTVVYRETSHEAEDRGYVTVVLESARNNQEGHPTLVTQELARDLPLSRARREALRAALKPRLPAGSRPAPRATPPPEDRA